MIFAIARIATMAVSVLIVTSLVSACSVGRFGKSESELAASESEIIKNSVANQTIAEGINQTDAETIKLAVTALDKQHALAKESNLMAWNNPQTGNSGTITAIDDFVGSHGQSCRKFTTTVDSFMGISLYNGETCELKKGFWVISWFLRVTGN